jgi:hypothetical protein
MATAAKRKGGSVVVHRRAPSVPLKKFEAIKSRTALAARKGREVAAKRAGTLVGAGAAYAIGWLQANQKVDPKYLSPAILGGVGAGLTFFVADRVRGQVGAALAEAGSAALGVAAYRAGLGEALIGADDDVAGDDSVEGDWE